jgi:hypothetical protein
VNNRDEAHVTARIHSIDRDIPEQRCIRAELLIAVSEVHARIILRE